MNKNIVPPEWDQYDEDMLVNVRDMRYYFENYTEVTNELANDNKLAVENLNGRVAKLEQEQPVGPGGTGAFLNLGGVPERYPTAEEMVAGGMETGFMVVARTDGIYFYNPTTKVLIKPKTGGGTMALHGQLPMIYDNSHKIQYNGRVNVSGIYTAVASDVGLSSWTSHETCKILVVVTETEEFHTAMGPDGYASRIFRPGVQSAMWTHFTGSGGGGGGSVDQAIIDEINDRIDALEQHDHIDKITDLTDVIIDPVLDSNGILYVDGAGKVRAGHTLPCLTNGHTHVHANSVGSAPAISSLNVNAVTVARSSVIILRGSSAKTVTLPNVVAYNTFQPSSTEVREGRTTFLVNTSDTEQTVQVPAGGMFYIEGSMDSTNAVIPPKTVYVYNPAIIDNGSGAMMECWVYMGNYALRATDMTAIMSDLQLLKDQVDGYNDAINTIVEGFEDMSVGDVLTSYNGLGCRPIASSNDVSATNIAANPFAVGQGTSTGKKFTLPDICGINTVGIPADTVREGRITILSNFSTVPRTVHLTGGCKFNMTGSNVTTTQTMPAKTTWLFSPGVYSNGDKVWTYIGSMFGDTSGSTIVNSSMRVTNKNVTFNGVFTTSEITQANVAASRTVALTGSTSRYCRMPEVVSHTTTATLTDTQVRQGFTITIGNFSATASLFLAPVSGQKWYIGAVESEGDRELPPGVMETFMANIQGGTQKWVLIGRSMKDGSPVGFDDLNTRVETLEAIPTPVVKNKFTELDDTPSGYQPGKLVGYNLTGDAMIAVDKTERFHQLTDTPSDYSGHARKYLAVNPSEDGIDFITGPDVAGLTTDVNNLHNDMITANNNITVQGNQITALDTRVTDLENDSGGGGFIPQATKYTDTALTSLETAAHEMVVFTGSSAANIQLPVIVDTNTTPGAGEVREGTKFSLLNMGSASATLTHPSNQGFFYSGAYQAWTWGLQPGMAMHMIASITPSNQKAWVISEVTECDIYGNLEYGRTMVHMNSIASSVTRIASNFTQYQGSSSDTLILQSNNTTNRTVALPTIVSRTQKSMALTECREGKTFFFKNESASATMTLNAASGQTLMCNGTTYNSLSIPGSTLEIWKAGMNGSTGTWYFLGRMSTAR